jgi:hypothetical protein
VRRNLAGHATPVDNDVHYCREDALYVGVKSRNQIIQLFFIRNGGILSLFTKNRTPLLSAATHKTPLLTAARVSSNRKHPSDNEKCPTKKESALICERSHSRLHSQRGERMLMHDDGRASLVLKRAISHEGEKKHVQRRVECIGMYNQKCIWVHFGNCRGGT